MKQVYCGDIILSCVSFNSFINDYAIKYKSMEYPYFIPEIMLNMKDGDYHSLDWKEISIPWNW